MFRFRKLIKNELAHSYVTYRNVRVGLSYRLRRSDSVWSRTGDKDFYLPDGIHLNKESYKWLAGSIIIALKCIPRHKIGFPNHADSSKRRF